MSIGGTGGIHQLSSLLTRGGEQARRAQRIGKLDKRKEHIAKAKGYLASAQKTLEELGDELQEDKLNDFAAKVFALEADIATAEAQGEHVQGSMAETIQYYGGRFFAQITGDKETQKLYDAIGDAESYLDQLDNFLRYHRNEYLFDERSVAFLDKNHAGLFRLEEELKKVHFPTPLAGRKDSLLARISGLKSYVEAALLLNKTKGEIDLEGLKNKRAEELGELKNGISNLREVAEPTANESVKALQLARLDQIELKVEKAFEKKWKSLLPLERKFLQKNSSEGLSHLVKDPQFEELMSVLVTHIFHFVKSEDKEHALWQLGHLMAKVKAGNAETFLLPLAITKSSSFMEGEKQGWMDLIQKVGDPMDREVVIRKAFSEGQTILSLPRPPDVKNKGSYFIALYRLTTLLERDQLSEWDALKLQLERLPKTYPASSKEEIDIRASLNEAFSRALSKHIDKVVQSGDVDALLKIEVELGRMKRSKKFQEIASIFDHGLAIVRETKLETKRIETLLEDRIPNQPLDRTAPGWPKWGQRALREYLTADSESDFNLFSPFAIGEVVKALNDRSELLSSKTIAEFIEKAQKGLTETPPRDLMAAKIMGMLLTLTPDDPNVAVAKGRFNHYMKGASLAWPEIFSLHLQALPQDLKSSMHFAFPMGEIEGAIDRALKMGDFYTLQTIEGDLEKLRVQQQMPVVRGYVEEALKSLHQKIEQNPRLAFDRIKSLMDQKIPESSAGGGNWDRFNVRNFLNLVQGGSEGERLSQETRIEIARCLNKDSSSLSQKATDELLALAKYDKHHPPRVLVQARAFALLSKFAPKDMRVSLARKTFREILVNSWKDKNQPTADEQAHIDRWFPSLSATPPPTDRIPGIDPLNRDLQLIGRINQNLDGKKKEEIKYLRGALEIASTEIVHLGSLQSFLSGIEKIKVKTTEVEKVIALLKTNIEKHEIFLQKLMDNVENFDHFDNNLKTIDLEKLLELNKDDIEFGKTLSQIKSTKEWTDEKGARIPFFSVRTAEMGVLNKGATLQPMLSDALIFGIPLQRAEKLQKLFEELASKSAEQDREFFSRISLALGRAAKAAL